MTVPRVLLTFCILVLTTGVGSADDPGLRTAKRHFDRGEQLYALTRFSDALDEYQKAFDAAPLADFLFNIGQCYRNLGDYESAVFSYRKYLTLAPTAPNRAQVEQLITELEAKHDANQTKRLGLVRSRTATADPAPRPGAPPIYQRWWFWTGLGVVAAGATGVVVYEATRPGGPPPTSLGNIVFGE